MTWPRAILFDVDGTLAETEESHRTAFNRAFAAGGLDWHWDRELYTQLLQITGGIERLRHFAGARADDVDLPAIHAFKNACYRQLVQDGSVHLRPGVTELVDEARLRGIRLGIATTTSRANVEALIASAFGAVALDWFEVMACAENVAGKKPDPAVYRFAVEALGLASGEVLAIEDSVNGLDAATGAGIACLLTPSLYCRADGGGRALLVLDDLASVPAARLLQTLCDLRQCQ